MCGIVGLFAKSPEIEARLGVHLAAMLEQMSSRGPDSAGVAVYRDPAAAGWSKLTLYSHADGYDWSAVAGGLAEAFGGVEESVPRAKHVVFVVEIGATEAEAWVHATHPELPKLSIPLEVMSDAVPRILEWDTKKLPVKGYALLRFSAGTVEILDCLVGKAD